MRRPSTLILILHFDFNPRTREGCDSGWSRATRAQRHFNPRTREGCDAGVGDNDGIIVISIHAPARGATYNDKTLTASVQFQSTHPRGVRPSLYRTQCRTRQKFQSTHPRGVRPTRRARHPCKSPFQSTHPRGVRLANGAIYALAFRFQSTHPRGVRPYTAVAKPLNLLHFNPRTREGCDLSGLSTPVRPK